MSRSGQCPRCRMISTFNDNDVGSVFFCQCTQALFVSDAQGFDEIPVYCQQCDGAYVVDRDGAGEEIQCDCGSQFTVPDLVLSEPIAKHGEIQGRVLNNRETESDPQAIQIEPTSSSSSSSEPAATKADDSAASTDESLESTGRSETKPRSRRQRKWSPASLLGIGLVVLFLMASLVMFVMRKSGSPDLAKNTKNASTAPPAPIREHDLVQPAAIDPTADVSANDAFPDFDVQANELPSIKATSRQSDESGLPPTFPPPADKPLPKPQPSRPIVAIPYMPMPGYTFDRAYQEAFDAFTEVNALEKKIDGAGDAEYQTKLGNTIAMLQASRTKMGAAQTKQQADEINQLLTFLYFRAGRLPEAAILAEAALRWGDPKKDGTKESAMVGLAAMQEANLTQWADANQVGELEQMGTIIRLFANRWPDDPRLTKMRMSLAQSLDRFGKRLKAAEVYKAIASDAALYAHAQLAAGGAYWVEYRKSVSELAEPTSQTLNQLAPLRDQAKETLSSGVNALIKDGKGLSAEVMSAKLNLARIELSAGNPEAAEKWLAKGKFPPSRSIGLKPRKQVVVMSADFMQVVYETLFSIQFQRNDLAAAKETLENMSQAMGKSHADEISKLHLSIATKYVKQLTQSPSVSRLQLSTLANLIDALKQNEDAMTIQELLWLGESWATLAPIATDETSTKQCYFKAAAAYQLAMQRADFPKGSRNAAILRRLELLRQAGRTSEALIAMTALLDQSPNAFAMQIQAAQATQDLAEASGETSLFAAALDGPVNSSIWGWNKLVSVLQSQRSTDETRERDTERLMQCRYNMLLCRWQITQAIDDETIRSDKMAELKVFAKRLKTTMKEGVEPWFGRFEKLTQKLD